MFKSFDRNYCTRHSSRKWKLVMNTSLILQQFIFSKFGARLTRIRFRIESESFVSRPKESESHEHDFARNRPSTNVHATAMRLVCHFVSSLSLSSPLPFFHSFSVSLSPSLSFFCPLSPTLLDVATDAWDFVKNTIVLSSLIEATEYRPMLYI
jgi:hypothetical protein